MQRAIALIAAVAIVSPSGAQSIHRTPAEVDALLANATVVGPAGQPELIVPLDVPGWADGLGVSGVTRHYKGVCGPEGAVTTIELLLDFAERDLLGGAPRATAQAIRGTSPKFIINYDPANTLLVNDYLPDFVDAAADTDFSFANRATIRVNLGVESIPGSVIGQAASTHYEIPWSTYVEGLRTHAARESAAFAQYLPSSSLPVRFGFPPTGTTSVTSIVVTDGQLRAIFGDNAVPANTSVSITLDSDNDWEFGGCDNHPEFWELSLIDVAVHEITHALGFTSAIWEGGDNPFNEIEGLDVARFSVDQVTPPGSPGGLPLNLNAFTTYPRHGEVSMASGETQHAYASVPEGFFLTLLEQGDGGRQPSHLMYFSSWGDKLGTMDPVLDYGRSRCDEGFWTAHDLRPLDDMGWYPVAEYFAQDCNGNGIPDIADILTGHPDSDGDFILDECENIAADINLTGVDTFAGLTFTRWSTPSLGSLDGFNPANYTIIYRARTDDASFGSGTSQRVVARVSGYFVAPEGDEYAFRVDHDNAVVLKIAGQTLLNLTGSRSFTRANSYTSIAPQVFINLDAGAHPFELTVLTASSSQSVAIMADSGALGGWRSLNQGDFLGRIDAFPDCDLNGVDDQFDPDSDHDGIPDACETPPCNLADLAEPYGLLDLEDVTTFVSGFLAASPAADLNGDGLFDLTDTLLFVTAFLNGC